MDLILDFSSLVIPSGFYWFNEPTNYHLGRGLEIITGKETDFWQKTHYGFQRDDGHCLFTKLAGDFSLTTHVQFTPQTQYDQCGLMVRIDAKNWIKLSTEYEHETLNKLGSVVTNLGYSDWATQDIAFSPGEMWYRISRRGRDYLLEFSRDGRSWYQMRIAHLHQPHEVVEAGPYACSPIGENFKCRFTMLAIRENGWFKD